MVAWLRLPLADPAERLAVPGAVGLALLGQAGALLGLAGGFRPPYILALLLAPLPFAFRRRGGAPAPADDLTRTERWVRRAAYALVTLLAITNLVRVLYPPTGFDALNYHLPAVARYLEEGRLSFPADLRFAAGPALVPSLFVLAAATGGDLAAQLVSFGLGLLAAAAVHALAGRAFGRTAGAAAMAVFYATPIVGWLSHQAYVDLAPALFATVALHALVARLTGGGLGWAAVSGCAVGAAAATRYLALVPCGILALDWLSAPRLGAVRRRLLETAIFLALALAMAAPWYARNASETGNPLYPVFNDRWGGRYWSEADVSEHDAYLRQIGPGQGPLHLLLVPFRLTGDPGAFGGSVSTGIGYVYLLLLPVAAAVRRPGSPAPLLASYAAGLTIVWFYTSQQTRFLLPALAPLAALAGRALQETAAGLLPIRKNWRGILLPVTLALLLVGVRWPQEVPPVGLTMRQAFLGRRLPGFADVQWVNERLPQGSVLYAFGEEGRRYYYRARVLGDWFGPAAYRRFLPADDPRAVLSRLQRLGATHLLTRDDFPSPAIRSFRTHPFWWDRLVPLASRGGIRLYRIRARGIGDSGPEELARAPNPVDTDPRGNLQ